MNISKIETAQAIALLSIVMANKIILNLPRSIISSTGSSAWLNVIYIVFLSFLFVFLVIKLLKKFPKMDILDISEYLGGKYLKAAVGIIFIVIFALTIGTVLCGYSETLKSIYFNQSPILYILLFLIGSACIANKFGIKAIAKVTTIITPIVFFSILIVLLTPIKSFVIQRFFPLLGYGFNETFLAGISNIFALSGLSYILLIPSLLKESESYKKVAIISLCISGFYLILSVCCTLLVFPFVLSPNENLSLYLLTKVSNYGELIHGVNTIFILLWIISVIAYISIGLFFMLYITQKISTIKSTILLNYCYSLILLVLSYVWKDYIQLNNFSEHTLKYMILAFVFVFNPFILILANIKKRFTRSQTTIASERNT
ncbi:MAG: GerAB/ArcD/ProY family transporter [Clostridia bacterium]|nr:GerAB/ArcD/ProY family transporter [Clostridia bacterium]